MTTSSNDESSNRTTTSVDEIRKLMSVGYRFPSARIESTYFREMAFGAELTVIRNRVGLRLHRAEVQKLSKLDEPYLEELYKSHNVAQPETAFKTFIEKLEAALTKVLGPKISK